MTPNELWRERPNRPCPFEVMSCIYLQALNLVLVRPRGRRPGGVAGGVVAGPPGAAFGAAVVGGVGALFLAAVGAKVVKDAVEKNNPPKK